MTQFRAPGRYVQGEGVLAETGDHLGPLGAEAAVVAGGETALSMVETPLFEGIDAAGIDHRGTVRGIEESTDERIGDVEARIEDADADLAIGVGGTTAIDAAKAAAFRTGTEFVAVPTLASADGPAAGLAVVYDGAGRPAGVETSERNPALVLVDTGVVADAPARFLRSGIGDSLSTRFEAAASRSAGGTTIHGVDLAETAAPLAEQVYENIAEYGEQALADVERGESSVAVETIVETVHLTSVLAWENGGLAGAHALEAGLRGSGSTEPHHGPLVALCTLAETVWQGHPDRDELAALMARLGFEDPLPADADVETGATAACESGLMANEPVDVTPARAVEALETARDLLADA